MASSRLVPWQMSTVCSEERTHGGRYSYWTLALARNWSMILPPQPLSWSPQRAYQMQALLTVGCGGGLVRPGRTGGSRILACMWPGPARTAHLIASVLGRILCASSLHLFDWPGRCEPFWSGPHCSHYISGVHQQLILILEDDEPVLFHFADLVHGTLTPHSPLLTPSLLTQFCASQAALALLSFMLLIQMPMSRQPSSGSSWQILSVSRESRRRSSAEAC